MLSREVFLKSNDLTLAKKIYLLNKALFGLDVFYEVELPPIFLFVHPVGTVLGRAKYSDYLVVYQRVGVGSNHGIYPTLGEYVTLHPGAMVLGNSQVGNYCSIGAESLIIDKDIPDNSVYIGNPKEYSIKSHSNLYYDFWKVRI
jgi:serine O-acetyltransferase